MRDQESQALIRSTDWGYRFYLQYLYPLATLVFHVALTVASLSTVLVFFLVTFNEGNNGRDDRRHPSQLLSNSLSPVVCVIEMRELVVQIICRVGCEEGQTGVGHFGRLLVPWFVIFDATFRSES
jgi:hypothetical protein